MRVQANGVAAFARRAMCKHIAAAIGATASRMRHGRIGGDHYKSFDMV